jgi:hypothetical protein
LQMQRSNDETVMFNACREKFGVYGAQPA